MLEKDGRAENLNEPVLLKTQLEKLGGRLEVKVKEKIYFEKPVPKVIVEEQEDGKFLRTTTLSQMLGIRVELSEKSGKKLFRKINYNETGGTSSTERHYLCQEDTVKKEISEKPFN